MFKISFDKDNDFLADFGSSDKIFTTDLLPVIQSIGAKLYYDTQENWDAQLMLTSEKGSIYVYSNHTYIDDGNGNLTPVPAIKIGDGTSYLIDMPFVDETFSDILSKHIHCQEIHVTNEERSFWNNKVGAFISSDDNETLILSKILND